MVYIFGIIDIYNFLYKLGQSCEAWILRKPMSGQLDWTAAPQWRRYPLGELLGSLGPFRSWRIDAYRGHGSLLQASLAPLWGGSSTSYPLHMTSTLHSRTFLLACRVGVSWPEREGKGPYQVTEWRGREAKSVGLLGRCGLVLGRLLQKLILVVRPLMCSCWMARWWYPSELHVLVLRCPLCLSSLFYLLYKRLFLTPCIVWSCGLKRERNLFRGSSKQ